MFSTTFYVIYFNLTNRHQVVIEEDNEIVDITDDDEDHEIKKTLEEIDADAPNNISSSASLLNPPNSASIIETHIKADIIPNDNMVHAIKTEIPAPRPTTSVVLDHDIPHALEIQGCPEFFTLDPLPPHLQPFFPSTTPKAKSKTKTMKRYLKIRNFIMKQWEEIKPGYMAKTSIRKGLRGEGDVHAITRVFELLERLGCINNTSMKAGVEDKGLVKSKRHRVSDEDIYLSAEYNR